MSTLQQIQSGQNQLQEAIDEFKGLLSAQERTQLEQGKPPFSALEITNALNVSKKAAKLVSRCGPLIQSVQQFSGIVDTMIQHSPFISALVWGSVKFLLLVGQNYGQYFAQLTEWLEKLGKLCPIFSEFQLLLPHAPRLGDAIAGFYAHIVRFCCEALRFLRLSGRAQLLKSLWKPFDIGFQDIEVALQSQQKLVDYEIRLASEAAAFEQRRKENMFREQGSKHQDFEIQQWSHNKKWIQQLEQRAKVNENRQLKQWNQDKEWRLEKDFQRKVREREKLLSQISDYDHTIPFLEARKTRHEITGNWLYKLPQYCNWATQQTSSILCCHGIPGSGKTVLATAVIEYILLASGKTQHPTFIGYFFCDFSTPYSLSTEAIIRSFIKQILTVFHGSSRFEDEVSSFFQMHNRIPTMKAWYELFIKASGLLSPESYFFIDGLDECSEDHQRQLLKFIDMLMGLERRCLKFFISTRPDIYILRYMNTVLKEKATLIDLNDIEERPEIGAFIEQSLSERQADGRLVVQDPSTLVEIKNALMTGAKGMFLWVQFQIYDICRQLNDEEIRRTLSSLPRDLDETYIRILRRIEKERRKDVALEIFTRMAVARRPLTLGELREAVSIRPGDVTWNQAAKRMPTDAKKLLENCGNLVVVIECLDPIVQFAHSTVLKFLTSYDLPATLEGFHVDSKPADLHMGQLCLTYLHFPELQKQIQTIPVTSTVNVSFPNTPRMLIPSEIPMNSPLRLAGGFFHKSSPDDTMGLQLYNIIQRANQRDASPQNTTTLVKARFPLLDYIIQYWIHHCAELPFESAADGETGKSGRMFRDVVLNEMIPFTRMPWSKEPVRTNDKTSDEAYESQRQQFQWAVRNNHRALFQLVLSEVTKGGIAPLQYISDFLENEPTTYGYLRDKPYVVAALMGYRVIMGFLLSNGQNIDMEYSVNGGSITALMAASIEGHVEAVELLLSLRANVNNIVEVSTTSWRTALGGACSEGHRMVIQKLSDYGADVNALEGEAIVAAVTGRHLGALEGLMKFGTATEASLNAGIAVATKAGDIDVLAQLLEYGASHEAALVSASEAGQMDILLALLEEVPHWEILWLVRALSAASSHGQLASVARILEFTTKAGYDTADHPHNTALVDAVRGGHLETLKHLVAFYRVEYANIRSLAWKRWAALEASATCQKVIQALVEAITASDADSLIMDGNPILEYLLSSEAMIPIELLSKVFLREDLAVGDYGAAVTYACRQVDFAMDCFPNQEWYKSHPSDWTAGLIVASHCGHVPAVLRLLALPSEVYESQDRDTTIGLALIEACKGGHAKVVTCLTGSSLVSRTFTSSGKINTENTYIVNAKNGAALREAAKGGYTSVVKELLIAGAAMGSSSGRLNALLAAREGSHFEVMRELLRQRIAEFLVPSLAEDSYSTLQTCEARGFQWVESRTAGYQENKDNLIEILGANNINVDAILLDETASPSPLREAVLRNDSLALEIMFDAGADLSVHGKRALILACTFNRMPLVRQLLSMGVNVNAYDERGGIPGVERCALFAAIQHASFHVVKFLLDSGAEVNARVPNSHGTALHYACSTTIDSVLKVRLLLNAGAEVDAVDMDGRTPMANALRDNENSVLEALSDFYPPAHQSFIDASAISRYAEYQAREIRAKELEAAVLGREHLMPAGVFELA